jgi:hypothetical protein
MAQRRRICRLRERLLSLALVLFGCGNAAAGELEQLCEPIKSEIDCTCTLVFFRERLGAERGRILLKLIAAGAKNHVERTANTAALYEEFGSTALLDASLSLYMIRDEYDHQCHPTGAWFQR